MQILTQIIIEALIAQEETANEEVVINHYYVKPAEKAVIFPIYNMEKLAGGGKPAKKLDSQYKDY